MDKLKYIRIYKLEDGQVIIDFPAPKYQTLYEKMNKDVCPLPDLFRSGQVPFVVEIISAEDFNARFGNKKCEAGSAQYYYDDNGQLQLDDTWELILMNPDLIRYKYFMRLQAQLDAELTKATPSALKLVKLQRTMQLVPQMTELQTYEKALELLSDAPIPKDAIHAKLEAKIAELKETVE